MPESPIRKLAPLAADAKKRGIKVYHLNIGQPDLPTPQVAIDAIKHVDRKILEYSPSQGYRSYREKLVGYYRKYGISVTADDIIVTCGGSEAMLFAFMSCLNPGDEIIVPEPAYANYMAFAISAGAKIRTITTTIEEGFCLPKVAKRIANKKPKIKPKITPAKKAIFSSVLRSVKKEKKLNKSIKWIITKKVKKEQE